MHVSRSTPFFRNETTPWRICYRGTGDTSDGVVESPYNLTGFDEDRLWWPLGLRVNLGEAVAPVTPDDNAPAGYGTERFLYPEGMELQLLPLFSVDAAIAAVQLWGFDAHSRSLFSQGTVDTEEPEPRFLLNANGGAKLDYVLGEAYNLSRDDPGNPRTIAMAAKEELQTVKAGLVLGDRVYRDQNGDTFAVGLKHRFNTLGYAGFMVNVPALSSGELIILSRFVNAEVS